MKKVFIFGGVSYDAIIQLDEFPQPIPKTFHQSKFKETVGSTGSGKALNLCRMGFNVTLHALIGNDWFGQEAQKQLKHPKLSFLFDHDPNGTQRHVNIMNKEGERISIFVNTSSDEPKIDYHSFKYLMTESDYVVINILNHGRFALPVAKEVGKPIWTDLHDYNLNNPYHQDFIEAADYIFLSSDNLPEYRAFMHELHQNGKELVVCTHGKGGASALTRVGKWIDEPIIDGFELVDSNGAGDAFFSGFLYGFDKGLDLETCLKVASYAGSMCVNSEKIYHPELSAEKLEAIISAL